MLWSQSCVGMPGTALLDSDVQPMWIPGVYVRYLSSLAWLSRP